LSLFKHKVASQSVIASKEEDDRFDFLKEVECLFVAFQHKRNEERNANFSCNIIEDYISAPLESAGKVFFMKALSFYVIENHFQEKKKKLTIRQRFSR